MADGKHKLKIVEWVEGVIHVVEEVFESIEEALGFSEKHGRGEHKIYDDEGCMVHSKHHGHHHKDDSYA